MKRFVTILLLVAVLMNAFVLCASAEASAGARNSNYFSSYGVHLTDMGSGKIKIAFSATGTGLCDELGVATYYVVRKDSSGNWEEVSDLLSGKTASNVTSYTFSKYFYGIEGESYRVKATFISTINGSSEFKTITSGTITV